MDAACVPRLTLSFPAHAFFGQVLWRRKNLIIFAVLFGPLSHWTGFHPGSRGSTLRATKKAPNRALCCDMKACFFIRRFVFR